MELTSSCWPAEGGGLGMEPGHISVLAAGFGGREALYGLCRASSSGPRSGGCERIQGDIWCAPTA